MPTERIAEALRAARRDPESFASFYDEYASNLLAFTVRRVYDVDTAVDIVSETFAGAFLNRGSFKGRTDAEAQSWLFSIASRQIADYFRRSKVERRAVSRLGMEIPRPTEEDQARVIELAGLEEVRGIVRNELARLSVEQQEVLRLRIVKELPYDEVAVQLGISQDAARARVARGLGSLAKALEALDFHKLLIKEGLT